MINNEQLHPKLQSKSVWADNEGRAPAYIPTGRKATPKMLDFLAFRLIRKGYKVSRWDQKEVAV